MQQTVLIKSFYPVVSEERIETLDALRGFAIFGILIANIQFFSGNVLMPSALAQQSATSDQITQFLIYFFVQGKFYSIFCFLFGFGFALQIARAEERGDIKASFFKRRLFWLLAIGLSHAYLLWAGDILSIYAVTGFFLILFRNKPDRSLLKWAFALLAIPILSYTLVYILSISFAAPEAATSPDVERQTAEWNSLVGVISQGSFRQILEFNVREFIPLRYLGLLYEMRLPKILGMFLLGFYAYRRGYFHDISSHHAFIRRVMLWGLVLGIIGNAMLATLMWMGAFSPPSVLGIVATAAYALGVPSLALFYVAVIVMLWQKTTWRCVLTHLVPVGRMALTNYLLQTLICVFIFYGYGAGGFGKIGVTAATIVAFAIFLLQIPISALWLKHFSYGPMEWIWRQLTHRQRLALRPPRRQMEVI